MATLSPASKAALARLRAFKPPPTQYNNLPLTRRAAVLILLFADRRGELRVVLTIRSARLKNYAGHAALPGGKADSLTETAWTTARREAFEEIGLPLPSAPLPPGYTIEHLTELPTNLAMTELGVRPCVAFLRASASSSSDSDEEPSTSAAEHSSSSATETAQQQQPPPQQSSSSANTQAPPPTISSRKPRRPRTPDPTRDLIPVLDAKEVAATFTAPFANFLHAADLDPQTRDTVPGQWYQGAWHTWHETPWRMHMFYVPVSKGTVIRSRDDDDDDDGARAGGEDGEAAGEVQGHAQGLRADSASCSPRSPTPVLLADQEQQQQHHSQSQSQTQSQSQSQTQSQSQPQTRPQPQPQSQPNNPKPRTGESSSALDEPRYRVFGMTARILVDAARVAYAREPEFEHNSHFGDEDMIARLRRIGRLAEVKRRGEVLTREVMARARREGGREGGAKLS